MSDLTPNQADKVVLVLKSVAAEFGVSPGRILGRHRGEPLDRARVLCCHLVGEIFPGWSRQRLGQFLAHRNHSTITRAKQRYGELREACPEFAATADKLEKLIS